MQLNTDLVEQRASSEEQKDGFQQRWAAALADAEAPTLSVLEAACGSANDYRFLHAYGLARFMDYSGFDLSEANIANARDMFPQVDFRCGNVFEIPRGDASVDFMLVFDLFEHLSLGGLDGALDEVFRVARRGLVLNFFNVAGIPDHVANPVAQRRYHWNTLSLSRITAALAARSQAL